MVRKRLSKEYRELLIRNQKIVNVAREDDFDSNDQEECLDYSENSEDDVVTTAGAALEFPEEFQENDVEENTPEDDIVSCAANEKQDTFSGSITEDIENISDTKQEFEIPNFSLENLKPRRSRVRYPVNSLHYERLMKVVSSERSKHREIINSVTNTTFALSRRPLPHKNFKPRLRKTSPKPSPPSIKRKSVRFGNLITFDDNSTPVPVRPPRKKTQKSQRISSSARKFSNQAPTLTRRGFMSSNDTVDSFEEEDITPEKPRRAYRGREVTPLSEALQPLHDRHSDAALENIKSLMKAARQNIKDQNKKRSVLSSLNLFLCLAYERLRDPTFLTPELRSQDSVLMIDHRSQNHSDVSRGGVVSPKSRREVPTAIQQLKGVQEGRLYLRNIQNLLLFNLIHGRSL